MSVTPSISSHSSMTTWVRNAPPCAAPAFSRFEAELDDQRTRKHHDETHDEQCERARRASEEDVTRAAHGHCEHRDRGNPDHERPQSRAPQRGAVPRAAAQQRVGCEAQPLVDLGDLVDRKRHARECQRHDAQCATHPAAPRVAREQCEHCTCAEPLHRRVPRRYGALGVEIEEIAQSLKRMTGGVIDHRNERKRAVRREQQRDQQWDSAHASEHFTG